MGPLLFLLTARAAFSADASPVQSLCQAADAIRGRLQVCYDNREFADWSARCYQQFHELVASTSRAMKPGLARDSGRRQLHKFADTAGDYGLTIDKLKDLIAVNKRAEAELNLYLQKLVMPFDRRSLMDVPCIGDNVDKIKYDIANLREDRADLEKTLAASEKNQSVAKTSGDHLTDEGSLTAASATGGKRDRAPRATGRRTGGGPSDITGTVEAEKKDKGL